MRKMLLSAVSCALLLASVNVSAVADVAKQVTYPIAENPVEVKNRLNTPHIAGPPAMQPEAEVEVTIVPAYYRFDGPLRIDKSKSVMNVV